MHPRLRLGSTPSIACVLVALAGGACGIDELPSVKPQIDLTPSTTVDATSVPDESLGPDATSIADQSMPDQSMPDQSMPDQSMPDQSMPDFAVPDFAMPDFAMPDFAVPDFAMPDFAMPDFAMPDLAKPDLAVPDLAKPDLALPDLKPSPDLFGKICEPTEPASCQDATHVKQCRSDGLGYQITLCAPQTTCVNGLCPCIAGAKTCSGNDVLVCVNGTFVKDKSCGTGFECNMGLCDDIRCPDEILSQNPYALSTDGWPRYRHDNRNTGFTTAVVADSPKLKWKKLVGGSALNGYKGLAAGPIVSNKDVLFQLSGEADASGGSMYALNAAAMGAQIYKFSSMLGFAYTTGVVRQDGTLYFSAQKPAGTIFAVDPTGKQIWQFSTGSQADSEGVLTKEGLAVFGSDNGSIFAVDPLGKQVWKNSAAGEVDGGMAKACDGTIYAGGTGGWLAINGKTGATVFQVPASALASSPLLDADGTMYGVESGGNAFAIDPKGKVLWKKFVANGGGWTSVARVGTTLFMVLGDAKLHAIDSTNGNAKWAQPIGTVPSFRVPGPVVDGNQNIYVNSMNGHLYSFDVNGKQRFDITVSAPGSGCCFGEVAIGKDGTIYIPGTDGFEYAYQ